MTDHEWLAIPWDGSPGVVSPPLCEPFCGSFATVKLFPTWVVYSLEAVGQGCPSRMQAQLEQTIAGSIVFSGIGLHSGAPVQMRLLPAQSGTGIVFRRTDLDNFEIPATGKYVGRLS